MAYIECCNKKWRCDVYKLENLSGLLLNYAYFLEACPTCSHTVLILRRYSPDGSVSEVRKNNEKARKLFEKIRPFILYKCGEKPIPSGSRYFLRYNEYGVIKKCYSNFSSLQMGKIEPFGKNLPYIPQKLAL